MNRRRLATLTLLCQILLAAVAPVLDARQEARAAISPGTHIERDGSLCPPVHDHSTCLICRATDSFSALPNNGAKVSVTVVFVRSSSRPVHSDPPGTAVFHPDNPRAPPIA
ncbi:MAG: hypothetical protein LBG44_00910 [Gemmatimonadota bacterium]|nr:hypothetical protein [Gemmatimonadota bacterium]